jgi:hypothetical protein
MPRSERSSVSVPVNMALSSLVSLRKRWSADTLERLGIPDVLGDSAPLTLAFPGGGLARPPLTPCCWH